MDNLLFNEIWVWHAQLVIKLSIILPSDDIYPREMPFSPSESNCASVQLDPDDVLCYIFKNNGLLCVFFVFKNIYISNLFS